MKGLIIKDLYILKGTIATTLTILAILIVYCLFRGYGIGLVIIPTLVFAATTTSSLKLDWAVNWDKKALTMPINRKLIIQSKFLELVCLCIIGAIIGGISANIQNIFTNALSNYMILNFGLLSLALGIIGGSFHIMLVYRFGGKSLENSEILLFVAYGISVGVMGVLMWGLKFVYIINFEAFSVVPIIILLAAIIISMCAYKLTFIIYTKKEL
jgi:hypothetical protein